MTFGIEKILNYLVEKLELKLKGLFKPKQER